MKILITNPNLFLDKTQQLKYKSNKSIYIFFVCSFLILSVNTICAQNDYNPYQNFSGIPKSLEDHISAYTGEFQWLLSESHHWDGNSEGIFDFDLEYQIELVSFPFVSDYTKTSIDEYGPRFLKMADYNAISSSWSTFNGLESWPLTFKKNGTIVRGELSHLGLDFPFTLESIILRRLLPYGYINFNVFPQSIYKFKIYAMCDSIRIDSTSYTIDLNRGFLHITKRGGQYGVSRLYQYDLSADDIKASQVIIHQNNSDYSYSHLQLAVNGKIYATMPQDDDITYDSGVPQTMYISIIHNPNEAGEACNYEHLGQYLGGKKVKYGLPNMPNYNLGVLPKSACDTLSTSIVEIKTNTDFQLFPNPVSSAF